jgi:hypothetical protein
MSYILFHIALPITHHTNNVPILPIHNLKAPAAATPHSAHAIANGAFNAAHIQEAANENAQDNATLVAEYPHRATNKSAHAHHHSRSLSHFTGQEFHTVDIALHNDPIAEITVCTVSQRAIKSSLIHQVHT